MIVASTDPDGWKSSLLTKGHVIAQGVRANSANVAITLTSHPELKGNIAFDEFAQSIIRCGATPWNSAPGYWDDGDDFALSNFLQLEGLDVAPSVAHSGVQAAAIQNRVHPVRAFLRELVWDGVPRINDWLCTYLGAEPSRYVRAIGAKFLIGAIARIMQPGCKMDSMLVLEGEQGVGKSSAVRLLFGDDWFTDALPDISSKDGALQIQAKWAIEMSELDAFRRKEITEIKAFLSRTSDRYRPPYGRYAIDKPRQCVFVGTTNCDDYLKDSTGNRRFWPVWCSGADLPRLEADREQIWAEAFKRFNDGDQWHLTAEEDALAQVEQSSRMAEDPWASLIDAYVWTKGRVTTEEVLEKGIDLAVDRRDQLARRRVNAHLTKWGWVHKKSGGQRPLVRPATIPEEKQQFAPKPSAIPISAEEAELGL